MIGVIPAAGRGTRLGHLTSSTPKALLAVGGTPVLRRVLDGLVPHVDRIVVVVGHLAEQVERAVRSWDVPVPVDLRVQTEARGTADALLAARPSADDEPFLYAWCDVLVSPDVVPSVAAAGDAVTGALAVNRLADVTAGAHVTVLEGMVTDIVEKPPPGGGPAWNATGVGILPSDTWDLLASVAPSARGELEASDALRTLAFDRRLRAVPVQGPVFDIGTPAGLTAARVHFDPA